MAISNPDYRAKKEITLHVLQRVNAMLLIIMPSLTLCKRLHGEENAGTTAQVVSTPRDPFCTPFQPLQRQGWKYRVRYLEENTFRGLPVLHVQHNLEIII